MTSGPVTSVLFDGLRSQFPEKFVFGASTSAFQVDGASNDGKGLSIWDTHCFKKGLKSGHDAIGHYSRYKEDVGLMKWMGLDAYKFTISWSRIFPDGTGKVNVEGVQFYMDLLKELEENNVTPYVTLFHWDLPQALEDDYGGFTNSKIVKHFLHYADTCFRQFGDQVKHWFTFNEPHTFCEQGYILGTHAPGHSGNHKEPYLVAHHILLAHAAVVDLYKKEYYKRQEGKIGIILNAAWVEPLPTSKGNVEPADEAAQSRALDFTLNWFLHPITKGSYPNEIMNKLKEHKLVDEIKTDTDEFKLVKDSMHFLGINYYTAFYVKDDQNRKDDPKVEFILDERLGTVHHEDCVDWIRVYPEGLKELLLHVKKEYEGAIYVTENGYGEVMEKLDRSLPDDLRVLDDCNRVSYYHQHLSQLMEIADPNKKDKPDWVDVKGYFAWSLFDNFEWGYGFDVRFGSIYVDREDNMKRKPKFSAYWFKYMLKKPGKKEVLAVAKKVFDNNSSQMKEGSPQVNGTDSEKANDGNSAVESSTEANGGN